MQESNSIPLLELDAINISSINFNSDMETNSSDANETLHKNTDENNLPKSPLIFSRPSKEETETILICILSSQE